MPLARCHSPSVEASLRPGGTVVAELPRATAVVFGGGLAATLAACRLMSFRRFCDSKRCSSSEANGPNSALQAEQAAVRMKALVARRVTSVC